MRLDRARFLSLVRREPEVALAIAATLSRRLQAASSGGNSAAAARETKAHGTEPGRALAQPSESPPRRWKAPSRVAMSGLLAGAVLLCGWLVAPPAGLSASGWHALVLLAAAVPVLAVDALPEGVLALVMTAAWVLGAWHGPRRR